MLGFPKNDIFFILFNEATNKVLEAAILLEKIITDTTNIENKVKKMKEIEEQGDDIIHKILFQLHKSFITPLDREDIYQIAKETDEILDFIEDTACCFQIFRIKECRSEAKIISKYITNCIKQLVSLSKEFKNKKNVKKLYEKIVEINRIENKGDDIYREAVSKLFSENAGSIEIIKWKEIFELLENTLDACEDLANTIEGVLMKNA